MLRKTNGRIKVKWIETGEVGVTIGFEGGVAQVDFGNHCEWITCEELNEVYETV